MGFRNVPHTVVLNDRNLAQNAIYARMASVGYSLLLVLTAFIWGSGFVAQIEGNAFGPFAFSCIRCFIAAGFLAFVFKILDVLGKSPRRPRNRNEMILHWKAGFFCGLALCTAMNLQQLGMYLGTSAGKSGFLTACWCNQYQWNLQAKNEKTPRTKELRLAGLDLQDLYPIHLESSRPKRLRTKAIMQAIIF